LAKKKLAAQEVRQKMAVHEANQKATRDEATRKAALAKKKVTSAYVTSRKTPYYPISLRKKGIEGKVNIRVQISFTGKVTTASVTSSSGNTELDKCALKAAYKCKFKPAYNGLGVAISDTAEIPFLFSLK